MIGLDEAIERCSSNRKFFIETFFQIVDKNSKLVPFLYNEVQDDYWANREKKGIIVKARKMGFTSVEVADSVVQVATQEHRRCVLVSHEKDSTKRILKRAHDFIDNSLVDMRHLRKTDTGIYNEALKSSMWIGTAGSKAFSRGDDITKYHLTEYAYWDNSDLITGIEEACVNDAEGIIESTANGWGTEFHRIWKRAEAGGLEIEDENVYGLDSDIDGRRKHFYKPHFYAWYRDPSYSVSIERPLEDLREYEQTLKDRYGVTDEQLMWRRGKIQSMAHPEHFPQEYPATPEESFLVSGSMVFDSHVLREMKKTARKSQWKGEIVERSAETKLDQNDRGRFTIWIPPRNGRSYVASGDVAIGVDGGNYSVIDVWDVESWEQVAQWHGHIPPDDFGDIMMLVGAFYNWAFLAPESNNHGLATCIRIRDANYPKMLIRGNNLGGHDMGWYTSPGESGTRSELITAYGKAIRTRSLKLNSPISIHEAMSFVRLKNGKLGAQGSDKKDEKKSAFDDTVFSGGIGVRMLETNVQVPEQGVEGMKDHIGIIGTRKRGAGGRITAPRRGGY